MGASESKVKKMIDEEKTEREKETLELKKKSALFEDKMAMMKLEIDKSLQDEINKTNQSLQDQINKTNESVGTLSNSISAMVTFTTTCLSALAKQNEKMDVQINQTAKRMKRLEHDYYGYRSSGNDTSFGSDGEDTWDIANSADVVLRMQ